MSSLPNTLTIARIAIIPLFVAGFYVSGDLGRWVAFGLFAAAAITDAIDGIIARRWQAVSSLGRMLDPIADKLIVAAALLMLVADGTLEGVNLIPALVILCREILVSGLREFLAEAAVSLPVTSVAKFKTVMQMVAIAALIAARPGEHMITGVTGASLIVLWIAAGLTLYTGYAYLRAGLRHARTVPADPHSPKRPMHRHQHPVRP
ncbi:MAG: CDP-diacylglycerol--glycerol-3-phosphate 3-phosphatidyltransferase [Alphaproteobacteria bacterium]|nr:CDP-diacylglycerol--glycerol-3-phosphate 3-phosphatidyltransferase [Alphaproteobacteria bacterium]